MDFGFLEEYMKELDYEYLKMYHAYITDEDYISIHPRLPISLRNDFMAMIPKGKNMSIVIRDLLIKYVLENRDTSNAINTSHQGGDNTQNNQNTYITNNYYGDELPAQSDDSTDK